MNHSSVWYGLGKIKKKVKGHLLRSSTSCMKHEWKGQHDSSGIKTSPYIIRYLNVVCYGGHKSVSYHWDYVMPGIFPAGLRSREDSCVCRRRKQAAGPDTPGCISLTPAAHNCPVSLCPPQRQRLINGKRRRGVPSRASSNRESFLVLVSFFVSGRADRQLPVGNQ